MLHKYQNSNKLLKRHYNLNLIHILYQLKMCKIIYLLTVLPNRLLKLLMEPKMDSLQHLFVVNSVV